MSFDTLATPCFIALGTTPFADTERMLPKCLALPGVSGTALGGFSTDDWLAGNFDDLDARIALLPPGQLYRLSGMSSPASPNAPFRTVTVQTSFQGGPAVPRLVADITDPAFYDDYWPSAHEALFDHLSAMGTLDQCHGVGLGGAIAWGAQAELWMGPKNAAVWNALAPASTRGPAIVNAYAAMASGVASIAPPGSMFTFSINNPGTFTPDGRKDGGAFGAQCFAALLAGCDGNAVFVDETVQADGVILPVYATVAGATVPGVQPAVGVTLTSLPAGCPIWLPHLQDVFKALES